MKILIDDGMQIRVGTGIGKYTKYLYNYLKLCKEKDDTIDLFQYDKGRSSRIIGRIKYLFYINSKEYRDMCSMYDIVHYTNYAMPIIRASDTKYAVTIHDLSCFLYPQTFSKIYALYSQLAIRLSIKYADVLFTVSESAKNEIIQKWPDAADKIHVAYPGLYEEFKNPLTSEYEHQLLKGLQEKEFFLFVGTIEKRKNVTMIFEAFQQVKQKFSDCEYKLVYAGRPGYGYSELIELIDKSRYKDDVIFTGYTSTDDVIRLYKNAAAYVFPTIYEGFGSTQLECMLYHLPLILSDIPTNQEISGEYGLFFDLKSINSLKIQMENIITGQYDYTKHKVIADKIVSKYRWENVVYKFLTIYKNI